ncbi:hypothetical protein PLICRDRAFT_52877 [Plicaturopsis crispa FD-325 SS-3]|nr:hypothetical protein PLICRDRAFT_52877 [Plicaturopsis crispa FD-325 SS-3]
MVYKGPVFCLPAPISSLDWQVPPLPLQDMYTVNAERTGPTPRVIIGPPPRRALADKRRFGMVFPPESSSPTRSDSASSTTLSDLGSQWTSLISSNTSGTSDEAAEGKPTPAQMVAAEYYATEQLKTPTVEAAKTERDLPPLPQSIYRTSFHSNSPSEDNIALPQDPVTVPPKVTSRPPLVEEPKAWRPRSILPEFNQAAREAASTMHLLRLSDKDKIPCQRPDCNDVLANARKLKYHLHIHIIADGLFKCSACGGRYENSRELAMHVCRELPSPPPSPVVDGFRRVFNKIKKSCGIEDEDD